jgi:hypothetical protein
MHALGNRCHHLTITSNKFHFHIVGWVPPQTAQDVDNSEAAALQQSQLLSMGKQNVCTQACWWVEAVKHH